MALAESTATPAKMHLPKELATVAATLYAAFLAFSKFHRQRRFLLGLFLTRPYSDGQNKNLASMVILERCS